MTIVLNIIVLLLGFSFAKYREMPQISEAEMHQRLEYVNYASTHSFDVSKKRKKFAYGKKLHKLKANIKYNEYLHNLNGQLNLDIYQPREIKNKKLPVVIIFPPIGGVSFVDRMYAKYFASRGYISIISHLTEDIFKLDDVEDTMAEFSKSVVRNRILLDYLWTHPNVDNHRIGVFGNSLGGIRAALFYSIDTRVKAVATVVASANMPGTMAYSKQSDVKKLRKRLMAQNGLSTLEEYEDLLLEKYEVDASNFVSQVNPNHVFAVIGTKDDKVPTRYQKELKAKFGITWYFPLPLDHLQSIVVMFFAKGNIARFFDRSFEMVSANDYDEIIETMSVDEVYESVKRDFD